MKHQDEIRSTFQEWFVDCTTHREAAILYGKMYSELNRCFEEQMDNLDKDGDTNE